MSAKWLAQEDLLAQVGITAQELRYFQEQFQEQMKVLTQKGDDGAPRFLPDAVLLLRCLSAMKAQGATPEQIKGWFGLT